MIETVMNKWRDVLHDQTTCDYYKNLQTFLAKEYNEATIYPKQADIFNALTYTDYDDVKVVLLGQDPYHGPNQAHGLSFSVLPGQKLPPSLRNMMKELQDDLGYELPDHGELTHWAKQGVLLLNTVLTVRAGEAHSHKGQGWEQFTDVVIESIAKREQPVVFLLWGKPAQTKRQIIEHYQNGHIILEAPHPSPLSAHRGFFGSKPFSKTNDALIQLGQVPIDWYLPHKQAKLFEESMVK